MIKRTVTSIIIASMVSMPLLPGIAQAENQMGYQLLTAQQAAQLPRNGGALGIDVGSGQQITSGGMSFELLRVKAVRRGSPGAAAGLDVGDQIIAADAHVFPSIAAFAAYVQSAQAGQQIKIDYIPKDGGPQQAQRVEVTVGSPGQASPSQQTAPSQQADQPRSGGLSTGAKIAIGVGAAALFGCYERGCFSRLKAGAANMRRQ